MAEKSNIDFLGYLEYHGDLVDEGIMDARRTARALIGFDGALRHFAGLQYPPLKEIDYDIPVCIRKGSWQALIPDSIEKWVLAAFGVAFTKYLAIAAAEVAKNDFKDVDTKLIFSKALQSIQWIIRIGKHLGKLGQRQFTSVQWRNGNTEVGIPNEIGKYIFVPKHYIELYSSTPLYILSDMASIIVPGRQLRVVLKSDNKLESEDISYDYRSVFYIAEEAADDIYPELKHGQPVKLEGIVTRGNGSTNSIGFLYKGHILNCIPSRGSIIRFKHALFLKCNIIGKISREDDEGQVLAKKPKIIFDDIIPLEKEPQEMTLFGE